MLTVLAIPCTALYSTDASVHDNAAVCLAPVQPSNNTCPARRRGADDQEPTPVLAGTTSAFFRGNGTNVIKIAPETAIKLTCNDRLKRMVCKDVDEITPLQRMLSGALAGAVAQVRGVFLLPESTLSPQKEVLLPPVAPPVKAPAASFDVDPSMTASSVCVPGCQEDHYFAVHALRSDSRCYSPGT